MKKLFFVLSIMCFGVIAGVVFTQAIPGIIVTATDVEIRFPDANEPGWIGGENPHYTVGAITYLSEPIGTPKHTLKLGVEEIFEVEMFDSTVSDPRKAIIPVTFTSLPSKRAKTFEVRTRCRYEGDIDEDAGVWTESPLYRVIGATGPPSLVR